MNNIIPAKPNGWVHPSGPNTIRMLITSITIPKPLYSVIMTKSYNRDSFLKRNTQLMRRLITCLPIKKAATPPAIIQ